MRPMDVVRKSAALPRTRLWMELLLVLLFTALFAVMVGLGSLASVWLAVVLFFGWLALCVYIVCVYHRKVGFLFGCGMIGVMTAMVCEGHTSADPLLFGRNLVRRRFSTYRQYAQCNSLVMRSIHRIQVIFEKRTAPISNVQGMAALNYVGRMFSHIVLMFVRDACISYIFWDQDADLYAAACDSVVIYSYNWKRLTNNSSEVAVAQTVTLVLGTVLLSVAMIALFGVMHLAAFSFYAVILSLMLTFVFKRALLDPFLTARALMQYVNESQYTVLQSRYYVELAKISPAFEEMLSLAADEREAAPKKKKKRETGKTAAIRCPVCGTANAPDAKSCKRCGEPLRRAPGVRKEP